MRGSHQTLEEVAWLYQVGQMPPEDLPMAAAQALAVGEESPTLCELAGLSRHADPRDIHDAFEQALEELGIALPDYPLARRYALHRLATSVVAGEVVLADLASDEWGETEVETAEEQAFLRLLPSCGCCFEYTPGLDEAQWDAQLRIAARALVRCPAVGPGI